DPARAAAGTVQQPVHLVDHSRAGAGGRFARGVPARSDPLSWQPARVVPDPGPDDDPGPGEPGPDLHHHGEPRAGGQLPGLDLDLLGPLVAAGDLGIARLLPGAPT